ncbi:hypothetical protein ACIBTV_05125 [Micromonospora sp. NPDC049366]|uniref:hypothetical protein n=1 Tax=Micromonospora sp. NPDC049366 TaxID=3364271 RepID=UPI0037AB1A00
MIDLGDPDRQPAQSHATSPGRHLARRAMTPWIVVAFVTGVAIGGVGVDQLGDSRDEREQNAVVALAAFPESAETGGVLAQGWARLVTQMRLVNGGPAPITVRAVRMESPSVTIRGIGPPPVVPARGVGLLVVELGVECATPIQPEPLSMRFTVETTDRHVSEVDQPIVLVRSEWERDARAVCESPG